MTGMDRLLTLEHAVEANCISLVDSSLYNVFHGCVYAFTGDEK